MGYQESFIHTVYSNVERNNKDINDILEIFKKYDVRCDGDDIAECVEKLRFKKNIDNYKKGMEILWISGDRQAQRGNFELFDLYFDEKINSDGNNYTKEEMKLINRVKLRFLDNIGDYDYVQNIINNKEYTERIPLNLIPNDMPKNYEEVNKIFKTIKDKVFEYGKSKENIEYYFQYNPKTETEKDEVINIIKEAFNNTKYELSFKTEHEEVREHIRTDILFLIDGVYFGKISFLPWENYYHLSLYNTSGKDLRKICKQLEK